MGLVFQTLSKQWMLADFAPVMASQWLHIAVSWNKTGMFIYIIVFAYLINILMKENLISHFNNIMLLFIYGLTLEYVIKTSSLIGYCVSVGN